MSKYSKFLLLFFLYTVIGIFVSAQTPGPGMQVKGHLSSALLNEVSGMALSAKNKNILYVHNDSGDGNRFFAITTKGNLVATYHFTGVSRYNRGIIDFEDIAVGPGPVKGQSYIYLADIGDNFGWRSYVQIYRFAEPITGKTKSTNIQAETINLEYPSGSPDAETIMIDPVDQLIYIITKNEDSTGIYDCLLNFSKDYQTRLHHAGNILINEGTDQKTRIVSGDISRDGKQILLKSTGAVYYWKRQTGESVFSALQRSPIKQTNFINDGQQEAITFSADGKGYFVTAEGKGSGIYYYVIQTD